MSNSMKMIASAIVVFSLAACSSEDGTEQLSQSVTPQVQNESADQGRKAYKDPVTGQFTPPPAGQTDPTWRVRKGRAVSIPLSERTSPIPGGGVLVDLPGRFMQEMRVNKDIDGKLQTECSPVGMEHKSHEK